MIMRYKQPQIGVGLDQSNPLTIGAHVWLPTSPRVLFGKKTLVAATETAYNSSPIGDVGVARKWTRSNSAGVDFGTTQIITQNSGVTVLVVAAPTSAATMKVPFSQRVAGGNYTQTDFVFNSGSIDSLGASAGTVVLSTYHAGSGGVLANSQVDGKTHCWVAGNGPSNGFIFRDGIKQTLTTSTRMSTFTGSTQKLRIGNMADDATTTYPCDDPVYLVIVWDRLLSEAEAKAVSTNPWQVLHSQGNISLLKAASAGSNQYTLTCQSGSYINTGISAQLLKSKKLIASTGSYSITAAQTTIKRNKYLQVSSGSYSVSTSVATLLRNKKLTTQSGSYTLGGQSANITYTGSGVVYTLTCQSGQYNVVGQTASIKKSKVLSAQAGTYTITGKPASLNHIVPSTGSASGPYFDLISGQLIYLKPL